MGRSQETFSKKEKEKAREQKKKAKEKKKEDRKANRGQGEDTMLAYVDENGNLSSTPPDPRRKRAIAVDDVVISVMKQESTPDNVRREGTVTVYTESKGYGFIIDAQNRQTLFFHKSELVDNVHIDDKVSFQVATTAKGLSAVDVRKIV